MIARFIKRIFSRKPKPDTVKGAAKASDAPHVGPASWVRHEAHTYRASEQGIRREEVPASAMKTCEVLQQGGHLAYIVGGGSRDLLLGLQPKDFDIATNATPEQVVKLFRRARLIGRRFRIVHVMFGREMIEVSTFRAIQTDAETDEHGRVLRDNVWGSIEEDAARRDFTVNALYYDPVGDVLIDYHDGVADLRKRVLRMIGDPATRYREDPVRMLRTARFAAKLGFEVEAATREPIKELGPLISNVPVARLFDEMLKLLQSGHALQSLHELRAEGLHRGLLPLLDAMLEQPDGERFIKAALTRTDERVAQGKSVSPGFLFATLLWGQVTPRWQARVKRGEHRIPALMAAVDSIFDEQGETLAIQKRIVADIREIWTLQPRFERRTGRAPFRLLEHLRFRAGYDFLLLRCEAGETDPELGQWWTRFIDADGPEREELITSAASATGSAGTATGPTARRRRRRKRTGTRDDAPATAQAQDRSEPAEVVTQSAPPAPASGNG